MMTARVRDKAEEAEVLFAVIYADHSTAYVAVPAALANHGPSPPVLRIVRRLQDQSEIPLGEIARVARVRRVGAA